MYSILIKYFYSQIFFVKYYIFIYYADDIGISRNYYGYSRRINWNPTLNIRTSNNPFDWSALSYVEMTNSIWSSRSVGSSVDDIVDVSTLTFSMPIFINPPAKVKQQKLIYNIINELYSLDDEDLDAFVAKENFDKTTLQYTVITLDNRKLKYENGKAYLYN